MVNFRCTRPNHVQKTSMNGKTDRLLSSVQNFQGTCASQTKTLLNFSNFATNIPKHLFQKVRKKPLFKICSALNQKYWGAKKKWRHKKMKWRIKKSQTNCWGVNFINTCISIINVYKALYNVYVYYVVMQ